jgi:hypothetical protein
MSTPVKGRCCGDCRPVVDPLSVVCLSCRARGPIRATAEGMAESWNAMWESPPLDDQAENQRLRKANDTMRDALHAVLGTATVHYDQAMLQQVEAAVAEASS